MIRILILLLLPVLLVTTLTSANHTNELSSEGPLCTVTFNTSDGNRVVFGTHTLTHLHTTIHQYCNDHVDIITSYEDCTALGRLYVSQCYTSCAVQGGFPSRYSEKYRFLPHNKSHPYSELHSFCQLTAINPMKCRVDMGMFYHQHCNPFIAPPEEFLIPEGNQWYLLKNEPRYKSGPGDSDSDSDSVSVKQVLKESLIEEYMYCVAEYTLESYDKWNKHLGSYLSLDPDKHTGYTDSNNGESLQPSECQTQDQQQEASVKPESNVESPRTKYPYSPLGLGDDIMADTDEDISEYFQFLKTWCRKVEHPDWYINCYKFMLNLTNTKRCTTCMDSAYCQHDSGTQGKAQQVPAQRDFLRERFVSSPNTLNIVILGAGPVGLMAANLLVNTLASRVEVVVFEKRTASARRKKLYSREWLTELPLNLFNRSPNLRDIISNFVRNETKLSNIPINIIETLLLLDGRKGGVKFIYDDYKKYLDLLTPSHVDVVFDATGHRLSKFKYPTYMEDYTMRYLDSPFFTDHNIIGHSQDIRYPVIRSSDDGYYHPYTLYFLKINYLSKEHFEYITSIEKQHEDANCRHYSCGPYFPFKAQPPDEISEIFAQHPDEVVSNLLLVSLSSEQAEVITAYMKSSVSGTDFQSEAEIPIHLVPPSLLTHPSLKIRGFDILLGHLMASALPRTSITLPYRYDPYMYLPVQISHHIHHFDEAMPVLRIGNSLLSGDATASTGISTQFRLLSDIVRQVGESYYIRYN